MSQPYINPDGVAFGACHYCGYCERFGCEVNAKASAHFTVIPLAAQKNNVEMRTNARVMKVNLDTAKKRAESVTYLDAAGREFEQPGDLVVLCAYALGNVHLMLLSGIGKPYDPATGNGVVGRNYAYQIGSGATVFFDEKTWMNPFMGAGALGMNIDDFNSDSFDHVKEGFIGGGGISTAERRRPADRLSPGAARHASLGYGVEAGGRASLQPCTRHQQPGQRDGLSPELPRSRSDLSRSLSADRCCA